MTGARPMRCPIDGGVLREDPDERGSACPNCDGMWYPRWSAMRRFGPYRKPGAARPLPLRCPQDGAALCASAEHDPALPVCPDCGGVWLEGVDLQVRRLGGPVERPPGTRSRVVVINVAFTAVLLLILAASAYGILLWSEPFQSALRYVWTHASDPVGWFALFLLACLLVGAKGFFRQALDVLRKRWR